MKKRKLKQRIYRIQYPETRPNVEETFGQQRTYATQITSFPKNREQRHFKRLCKSKPIQLVGLSDDSHSEEMENNSRNFNFQHSRRQIGRRIIHYQNYKKTETNLISCPFRGSLSYYYQTKQQKLLTKSTKTPEPKGLKGDRLWEQNREDLNM